MLSIENKTNTKETTIKDIEQSFKEVLNSQQMKELDKRLKALTEEKLNKLKKWLNKPNGVNEKLNSFYEELKEEWVIEKWKEIAKKWKETFFELMKKINKTAKQKWWDAKWEDFKQKSKEKWKKLFSFFKKFLHKHIENIWKAPDINYTKAWNEAKIKFHKYNKQYKEIMKSIYEKLLEKIDMLEQSK